MADICRYCSAELFQGQRFCRTCGRTTDPLAEENTPTRRMPPPPDPWGARGAAKTAPTASPETRPVYMPPSAYQPPSFYQPPQMPAPPMPMPAYAPPRSNSTSWVLIVALIILTVLGGAIIGGRAIVRKVKDKIAAGLKGSSKEVVDTRTFALNSSAAVSIKTLNGSISVEESDQPQAEVRIIKRGNSDEDIQAIPITITNDNGNLSLEALSGRNNTDVRFEVKLPHQLGQVTISSTNGTIKVSEIAGQITISNVNGSISLDNVSGVERAETINGSIKAVLDEVPSDRPMSFKNTNGSIDLTIESDLNVMLDASTAHGSIKIGEEFNIPVQKLSPTGQRASGPIGKGGPPLSISTTNGSIKLNQ